MGGTQKAHLPVDLEQFLRIIEVLGLEYVNVYIGLISECTVPYFPYALFAHRTYKVVESPYLYS
jgi:hypothetical protein